MGICNFDNGMIGGKTVVITGGTSGIGLETAVQLAKRGCKLIIGYRNPRKMKAAYEVIKTHVPNAKLDFLELQLVRSAIHIIH